MRVALIVLDSTRKDYLTPYGGPEGLTPNISSLAERGIVFDNCISGAPWTPPSHATMFTGQYPSQHGARDDDLTFPNDGHYLPETLSQIGITTQGIGAEPWLSRRQGFDRGFDRFHDTGGHSWAHYLPLLPAGINYVVDQFKRRMFADYGTGQFTLHLFNQWVQNDSSFTFVNIPVAHSPYEPPDQFRDRADAPREPKTEFGREMKPYPYMAGDVNPDKEAWQEVRQLYAGGIAHADYLLGLLLDAIPEDTWIIFTADHGEHLGENQRAVHQFSLRDELINVPLIVSHPEVETRTENRLVSHIDIAPTVYDIVEREIGATAPDINLMGQSLLTSDSNLDRIVFSEYGPPVVATNTLTRATEQPVEEVVEEFFIGQQAAVDTTYKYIRRDDGTESLFRRDEEGVDIDDTSQYKRLQDAMDKTLHPLPNVKQTALDDYVEDSVKETLDHLGYR